MIFGIKSVIVWKSNLIANPSTIKFIAVVILIEPVLKKDFYSEVFLKECKYIEKEKGQLDILLMT